MTQTTIPMSPGDDVHLTLLMAPQSLNLVTGQDREHLLAFGRAAFEAGKATAEQGKCLHQIAEPAASVEKQIKDAIDALVMAAFTEGGCSEHRMSEARIQTELRKKELRTLLSTPQPCSRSHPHEEMTPMCELRTEIARLTNALARAEAAAPQAVQDAVPLFWVRLLRDGLYEGPVHNNSVGGKMLRDEKPGEWHPLYLHAAPAHPAEGVPSHYRNALPPYGVVSAEEHRAETEHAKHYGLEHLVPRRTPLYTHPTQQGLDAQTEAARSVLAERARQVSVEGWTPEQDDEYTRGILGEAGGIYALHAFDPRRAKEVPEGWPWDDAWWKPKDPRTNLVKAGALILAEIERMDRSFAAQAKQGEQANG